MGKYQSMTQLKPQKIRSTKTTDQDKIGYPKYRRPLFHTKKSQIPKKWDPWNHSKLLHLQNISNSEQNIKLHTHIKTM